MGRIEQRLQACQFAAGCLIEELTQMSRSHVVNPAFTRTIATHGALRGSASPS
jgi:hypothetical protein